MSDEFRPETCRLDPEIDLVEEAPPPSGDSDASEVPNEEAFDSLSPEDRTLAESALNEFRDEALALPEDQVKACRAPVTRVARNIRIGTDNVLKHRDRLRKELPYLEHHRVERLLRLALSVVFATSVAARQVKPAPRSLLKMKSVYHYRRLMLNSMRALADAGLVAKELVAAIQAGTGFRDALEDLAALIHFFVTQAAVVENRTPVTKANIEEATALVKELAPELNPDGKGLAKQPQPQNEEAILRDRLWTMLLRDFEELVKAGTYLFGQQVTRHVPPLYSGVPNSASKAESPGSEESGKPDQEEVA